MTTSQVGYRPQAIDTSIESDRFFFELLRQRSTLNRLQMAAGMMRDARRMSLASLHQRFSALTPQQFAQKVSLAWLQDDCPIGFTPHLDNEMNWIQDSTGLAAILHRVLTTIGIPYYITGGVAAIAYGEPRTTRDLDIVMEVPLTDIDRLIAALEQEGFYVPGGDDVRSGRMTTLGVTHIESISRADLLLSGSDEFDLVKFDRIREIDFPGIEALKFASAEDLILIKLRWGRQSQSEKQWRDAQGILKVQGDSLDFAYLTQWAARLDLIELLDQALIEAGR